MTHPPVAVEPSAAPAARRRSVLIATTAVGVAAPVLAGLTDPAAARGIPARARLEKLVGHTFTASHRGRTTRWRLDAVQDSPFRPHSLSKSRLAAWRRQDFVLEWSTRSEPEQGTFRMHHHHTGHFQMFAVPGQRRHHRTGVTAVFNRWRG